MVFQWFSRTIRGLMLNGLIAFLVGVYNIMNLSNESNAHFWYYVGEDKNADPNDEFKYIYDIMIKSTSLVPYTTCTLGICMMACGFFCYFHDPQIANQAQVQNDTPPAAA